MSRSTPTSPTSNHRRERRRLLRAGVATLGAVLLPGFAVRAQNAAPAQGAAPSPDPSPSQNAVSEQNAARSQDAASAASTISTTDLGGRLTLLQVAGSNVLALHGDDGALMIDGGSASSADALLRAVYAATGNDRINTLINTHWHAEQTGANAIVGAAGGVILAHEKTQMYLSQAVYSPALERRLAPLPEAARPNKTTRGDGSLEFGGQHVDYGWLPAAHTDGDLFVHFPRLNVLAAGGVVSAEKWPLLDYRNGAWLGGRVRAVERLASLVKADTRVVPAEGRLLTGRDIIRQRDIYLALFQTIVDYMNKGFGAEDAVAANPLKQYEAEFGDPSEFLDGAYRSMLLAYVPD